MATLVEGEQSRHCAFLTTPFPSKTVTWTTVQFPFRSPWESFDDDDDDDDDGNDENNQLVHDDVFLVMLKQLLKLA